MATIIETSVQSSKVESQYSTVKILIVGLLSGLFYLLLFGLIHKYLFNQVEPAGNIAIVISAVISTILMVKLKMFKSLIISVAAAISLWGISGWTDGFNLFEIIFFSLSLYVLAYSLFSWMVRIKNVIPMFLLITLVLITVRIASAL